jgi:hypothetical protein
MVASGGAGSMLHLFLGLKSLVKVSRFHTDGSVFRLHYRLTVMVLLAFTFIVTTRQYIGSPIMCVHTKEIPKEVLNTYCWIHPTYTLSSAHWKRVGVDVPHPGVDKTRDERDKKHVKYYQWVGFCLFFQVGMAVIHLNWFRSSIILDGVLLGLFFIHLPTHYETPPPTGTQCHPERNRNNFACPMVIYLFVGALIIGTICLVCVEKCNSKLYTVLKSFD